MKSTYRKLVKLMIIFQILFSPVSAQLGLIRYISAENGVILTDWRLEDNGKRYSAAISGSSFIPVIDTSENYMGHNSIMYKCPSGSVTQRIEHKLLNTGEPDGLNFNNERYIGFALKIPQNFETPTNSIIFCQAWQGDPYGPVAMLKFMNGNSDPFRIKCNIRNTATGPNSGDPDSSLWQGYINRNRWYSFVWYIKPRQAGDSGQIKLWINDSLKLSWTGNIGYLPASEGGPTGAYPDLVVKYGIYQPGSNSAHSLFFDEIKAADQYEEAKPFQNTPVQKITCPASDVKLYAGIITNDSSYQWQCDVGNGFVNIQDDPVYIGTHKSTLTLTDPPTSLYGNKYRCVSSGPVGIVYVLKFSSVWLGETDTNWNNSANWNCGILPDGNTDVIIQSPVPNFPVIHSTANCRSLTTGPNSSLKISDGATLNITAKP